MLGDIGLCDTEKVSVRRLASCFIKRLRRAAIDSWNNLDILSTGKRRPGQMAEDVSDFVGHIGAPETLLVLLELLMTCTQRGIFEVTMADHGARHLALQCMVMRCGGAPSP
jgi:hypothetical protein